MLNKIFQIGFNKCGTVSLWKIFQAYVDPRIKSIHWDSGKLAKTLYDNYINDRPLLSGYDDYIYFGDMQGKLWNNNKPEKMILPYISMYSLLDQQYPNSKFILNTRNIDNWITSRLNWGPGRDNDFYMSIYNVSNQTDLIPIFKNMWHHHHKSIISYFYNRLDQLLIFDIEKDSVEKIINFFPELKFDEKLKSFPHLNKSR